MSGLLTKVVAIVACECGYENDFEFLRDDLYSSLTQQCEECDQMIEVDVIASVQKGDKR